MPKTLEQASNNRAMDCFPRAIALLLFACGILFLPKLGTRDLWNPDEPRFALVAKEMLLTGEYLVPQRNKKIYIKKPPFFFWSIVLIAKIRGGLDEWVARLPSAVSATGLVIATFLIGRSFWDARRGLWAAAVLATTTKFYWQARFVQIDMLFSFLTVCAIFLLYLAYHRPDRSWRYSLLGFIFLGLGMLTKGPLALVLVFLAGAPYVLIRQILLKRKLTWHQLAPFIIGLVLCGVIVLPWYLLSFQKIGAGFAQKNLVQENLTRFFAAFDHKKPFYHYLFTFPLDFFPWSFFLPSSIYCLWKERQHKEPNQQIVLFLSLWLGLTFLFFSISQSKQGKYLLPLYPGFSLIVGWYCQTAFENLTLGKKIKGITIPLGCILGILILASGAGGYYLRFKSENYSSLLQNVSMTLIAASIGGFIGLFYLASKQAQKAFLSLLVTLIAVYFSISVSVLPAVNQYKSARPLCERLLQVASKTDRIGYFGSSSTNNAYIYYMDRELHEVNSEPEVKAFGNSPGQAFLFLRRQRYDRLDNETRDRWKIIDQQRVGHRRMLILSNEGMSENSK